MDFALTRAENVDTLKILSVFDGRNESSDLRRDDVKCEGLTEGSRFSESINKSSRSLVGCFLIAQNRESAQSWGRCFV